MKISNLLKNTTSFVTLSSLVAIAGLQCASAVAQDNSQSPKLYENSAKVDLKLSLLSDKKIDGVLHIPAQAAYGFPGKATTPENQAKADTVVDEVKQNISQIVTFDPALGCKYKVTDVNKFDSEKAEYEETVNGTHKKTTAEYLVLKVNFTATCNKALPKQNVSIDFSKQFKNIDKFLVEINAKDKRKFKSEAASKSFAL